MKNLIIGLLFLPVMSFAKDTYNIHCKYNDSGETQNVQFNMNATYVVESTTQATLSHSSLITFVGSTETLTGADVADRVVFATENAVTNVADYIGRKYNRHFMFKLNWTSVGAGIEYANLIISKEPIRKEKDHYGATIKSFDGALNVSYGDHHGDYVWIICTSRTFED